MRRWIPSRVALCAVSAVRRNDFISCTTAPGNGTLTALVANMFRDAGPIVDLGVSKASDATVSCPDPIGSFPIEPFVSDLTSYTESGFPGASESGILFEGWERTDGDAPFATKDVHHSFAQDGAELTMDWHLVINHAPGTLPKR